MQRNNPSRKWGFRFLAMADLVAGWSKDPSTKIGAVIVDSQRLVVSTGYNGFPSVVQDDARLDIREEKYDLTVHAEMNALLNARATVDDCTLYVTHSPCVRCMAHILQSRAVRIKRICCWEPEKDFLERWDKEVSRAISLGIEAGVRVHWFRRPKA